MEQRGECRCPYPAEQPVFQAVWRTAEERVKIMPITSTVIDLCFSLFICWFCLICLSNCMCSCYMCTCSCKCVHGLSLQNVYSNCTPYGNIIICFHRYMQGVSFIPSLHPPLPTPSPHLPSYTSPPSLLTALSLSSPHHSRW